MESFFSIIESLIGALAIIQVLYYLVFAFSSIPSQPQYEKPASRHLRMAVFIAAYKEDHIIIETVDRNLKQDYPKQLYDLIVLADSLSQNCITKLRNLPVKVIEIKMNNSTKAKSLNQGLSLMNKAGYDIAVVLDADNVMDPRFLSRINLAFNNGHQAVQGNRIAKNIDRKLSVLVGLSEAISNQIFRVGPVNLGLSSSLAGSGMAFKYDLLKAAMVKINDTAAEDKLLQMNIARQDITIYYDKEAKILDEKTGDTKAFSHQRSRWLATQYYAMKRFWKQGFLSLLKSDWSYANLALQYLIIPKTLILGILFMLASLSWITPMSGVFWTSTLFLFLMSLIIASPLGYLNRKTLSAITAAPKAIFEMFKISSRIGSIQVDRFVVTKKGINKP